MLGYAPGEEPPFQKLERELVRTSRDMPPFRVRPSPSKWPHKDPGARSGAQSRALGHCFTETGVSNRVSWGLSLQSKAITWITCLDVHSRTTTAGSIDFREM